MGVDDVSVDLRSLNDFAGQLTPRLQEVLTALTRLHHSDRPARALGDFQDARETADRYDDLHRDYVARLDRLVSAVAAAQTATGTITTIYHTTEALNESSTRAVRDLLSPGA